MRFYRCWAGTKHPATRIPEDADDMTPLMFHCDCMGSVWQSPAVIRERERNPNLDFRTAAMIAQLNPPPRNPVVPVAALESD